MRWTESVICIELSFMVGLQLMCLFPYIRSTQMLAGPLTTVFIV